MSVKRYEFTCGTDSFHKETCVPYEYDEGNWVRYEDYKKLEDELKKTQEAYSNASWSLENARSSF